MEDSTDNEHEECGVCSSHVAKPQALTLSRFESWSHGMCRCGHLAR